MAVSMTSGGPVCGDFLIIRALLTLLFRVETRATDFLDTLIQAIQGLCKNPFRQIPSHTQRARYSLIQEHTFNYMT